MKISVLLLAVMLNTLVFSISFGLCEDVPTLPASIVAVQNCIGENTSIRLLPELKYNFDTPNRPLTPSMYSFEISTVSPDGLNLFFIRELENSGWQSFLLDLTTGQVRTAKMPDQQIVKLGGIMPIPYVNRGVWDPVAPQYLYVSIPERIDENDYVYTSVWRVHSETMVGQQITQSSKDALLGITPDGLYLLFRRYNDVDNQFYRYSIKSKKWELKPEVMPFGLYYYAPSGELVAGFTTTVDQNNFLAIMDIKTERLANIFNQNQVLLSVPNGKYPMIIGTPTWLSNSSGLLVNTQYGNIADNNIWKVSINGEACKISSGAVLIANDIHGHYWLVQFDRNIYMIYNGRKKQVGMMNG